MNSVWKKTSTSDNRITFKPLIEIIMEATLDDIYIELDALTKPLSVFYKQMA